MFPGAPKLYKSPTGGNVLEIKCYIFLKINKPPSHIQNIKITNLQTLRNG